MKSEEWKTYRTRFLVKAKQLSSTLSFVDALGRQHSGRKGDYLVESSDGVVSIAPRQIFEDIYVPMPLLGDPGSGDILIGESTVESNGRLSTRLDRRRTDAARPDEAARTRRKLPQPCRASNPRLGVM